MPVTVGTFNLNNLFSRFNFQAEIEELPAVESGGLTITVSDGDSRARMFMGRLVKEKDPADTAKIAERIRRIDIDVLAVQEVEHIDILKTFNRDNLGGLYPHVALIEGNDPRFIDVGVMSKLPIGPITSFQTAVHPNEPGRRVFGRDLMRVEILADDGSKLFSLYNVHLKSHYVPFDQDQEEGARLANAKRQREAETVARLISATERSDAAFVLCGDMNDPPDSEFLGPMLTIDGRSMFNGLAGAEETRPAKPETAGQGPGPQSKVWTHRYNPPGPAFPEYELYDQVWLSDRLSGRLEGACIDRRTLHGGDGSDHDPAWVSLAL